MDIQTSILKVYFNHTWIKIGIIIVLLAIISGSIYAYMNTKFTTTGGNNTEPTTTQAPSVTVTATAIPVISITPVSGGTLYTSSNLGVAFSYATKMGENQIEVKEAGNVIHVYNATRTPNPTFIPDDITGTQFVQVLTKSPMDTLEQAITKQLLSGYDLTKCVLGSSQSYNKLYPSTFHVLVLGFSSTEVNTYAPAYPPSSECPQYYTSVQNPSFFLMDSNHPNKYLFVSIGQTPGPNASENTNLFSGAWHQTLQVF